MKKQDIIEALAKHGFEAKEDRTNQELALILDAFESRAKIKELTEALAAQQEVGAQVTEQLTKIEEQEKLIEALQSTVEDMQKVIDEQASEVETAKQSTPVQTISHKNKTYVLAVPSFRIPGVAEPVNAERLKEEPGLVDAVLKIQGQAILKAQ